MDRLGSGGVVGRLGFRVGVSASYRYITSFGQAYITQASAHKLRNSGPSEQRTFGLADPNPTKTYWWMILTRSYDWVLQQVVAFPQTSLHPPTTSTTSSQSEPSQAYWDIVSRTSVLETFVWRTLPRWTILRTAQTGSLQQTYTFD